MEDTSVWTANRAEWMDPGALLLGISFGILTMTVSSMRRLCYDLATKKTPYRSFQSATKSGLDGLADTTRALLTALLRGGVGVPKNLP
jgi:hypothetical protein